MNKTRASIIFVLLALISTPIAASSVPQEKRAREHSINQVNDNWNWRHRDDNTRLEVDIRGRVEFSEDYKEIRSISDGGSIRITDERGGVTRKFEAVATSGGVSQSYWVQGQSTQLDAEARAWLARTLESTVVQGGYDARPRAQRILRERGPNGVIDEISKLRSDHVKRVYFDELVKSNSLDSATARRAIEQAGREMRSDYEKAGALIILGERFLGDEAVQTAYLTAIETIGSDYERGRVLSTLLKKGGLSDRALIFTLRVAAGISSDYEKAQALVRVAESRWGDGPVAPAYLEAAGTIGSDYERGRAVSALLMKGAVGKETLLLALRHISAMNSDYEKAQALIKVAAAGAGDEAVRAALVDAAKTLKSDYERGRVLNAVFK